MPLRRQAARAPREPKIRCRGQCGSWTAILTGTATDDGLPNPPAALTYTFTKVSGNPVLFGSADAARITVEGSETGACVFMLTVSDGALSASDTVAVTVTK